MKYTFFILFFALVFSAKAQSIVERKIAVDHIEQLHLKVDEVFGVYISTNPKLNELKIKSYSEGEYAQNIGFNFTEENKTLTIQTVFPEILTSGYDKLSAHKVFAVRLEIEIPEYKSVIIQSDLASVYGSGNYTYFETELKSGRCELYHFSGKALINTFKGDIEVETLQENITAYSTHGEVKLSPSFKKGNKISLKSIDGDINVRHEE